MSSGDPTPNLGLHTYETLDDFDFEEISADNLAIDTLLVPTVCTSVTRPAVNLFPGRYAYETDTKGLVIYDGDSWEYVSNNIGPLSDAVAVAAGWTIEDQDFVIRNNVASLYIQCTRTGAAIAAQADGNIVNSAIATVTNPKHRPKTIASGSSGHSGINVGGYIMDSTGTVGINSAPVNIPINTGTQLTLGFTYVTAMS